MISSLTSRNKGSSSIKRFIIDMSKGELFDYVVLGGGIVGVSTALSVKTKHPEKRVLLLEKERVFCDNIKLAIIVV
jgi:hypothetical protein